jgi:hypothetical protein
MSGSEGAIDDIECVGWVQAFEIKDALIGKWDYRWVPWGDSISGGSGNICDWALTQDTKPVQAQVFLMRLMLPMLPSEDENQATKYQELMQ